MSLSRIYITPKLRGKGFQLPMLKIAGLLYDSVQIQEILLNEDLDKYGEVEAHYKKMEFMRDTSTEDRYFNILDKKSRLFKMIRFTKRDRQIFISRKYAIVFHYYPIADLASTPLFFGCPAITSLK